MIPRREMREGSGKRAAANRRKSAMRLDRIVIAL
jgi:hypothetical protein